MHSFHYSEEQIAFIDKTLKERLNLYRELLPHNDPNFGLDPYWIRCYPYEQPVNDSEMLLFRIEFTNHATSPITIEVEPVLPEGWLLKTPGHELVMMAPPLTSGIVLDNDRHSDKFIPILIEFPSPPSKGQYILPIRVKLNDDYWGQQCHTIIHIR